MEPLTVTDLYALIGQKEAALLQLRRELDRALAEEARLMAQLAERDEAVGRRA